MNTLSKKITPIFFKKENKTNSYNDVKVVWLNLQKSKEITLAHHILYSVLRGKDWRKAFTPITNQVKLDNGMRSHESVKNALYSINSRLDVFNDFSEVIEPELCSKIVRRLLSQRHKMAFENGETAYNLTELEDILKSYIIEEGAA